MKLFKPSSWTTKNRIAFEAAWKIGIPLGIIYFVVAFLMRLAS